MKFTGLILLAFIVQAFAFPSTIEDPSMPEHMPQILEDPSMPEHMQQILEDVSKPEHMPKTPEEIERIEQFRRDILMHFSRFQTFYDLFTERMTNYRINHAELATELGLMFMEIFSNDIDIVRESKAAVDHEVAQALTRLGGTANQCLDRAILDLQQNSERFGQTFGGCIRRANATFSGGLNDIFYPTFNEIQITASTIPLLTLGALARGNPLISTTEVIDYLEGVFQAMDIQWKIGASQLFRWETARFDTEARFYLEEMNLCLLDPLENYRNTNTVIMFRIVDECAPTLP